MRFGVIGTSFITDWFLAAGAKCDGFELAAVYSREEQHAQEYAAKHGASRIFTNLNDLAASTDIDAVYVASPNFLHCNQSIQMLEGGKHVLCEKPAASNSGEWQSMLAAASANQRLLLEAMRPVLSPTIEAIRLQLPRLGAVRRVSLVYNQYSSRYDKFKNGIVENAFRPELSNGALMDIGVYCIEIMVALFGAPSRIQSASIKLENGLDGQGFILAAYNGMLAEISYSKISDGVVPSVIQGENGSLIIKHVTQSETALLKLRGGVEETIPLAKGGCDMAYEIQQFMRLATQPEKAAPYHQCTTDSLAVMDEARRQQGLVFPADKGC